MHGIFRDNARQFRRKTRGPKSYAAERFQVATEHFIDACEQSRSPGASCHPGFPFLFMLQTYFIDGAQICFPYENLGSVTGKRSPRKKAAHIFAQGILFYLVDKLADPAVSTGRLARP
jgi:hypothetical protein